MTWTAAGSDIPAYPTPRDDPFSLPAELRDVPAPVSRVRLWNGQLAWLVTGYAEARSVLTE
jgi:hypothetical protein